MKNSFVKRQISLTTRVMTFVALSIGVSLLGIGYLVNNAVKHHFAEQDAEELRVMTNAVDRTLRQADDITLDIEETLSKAVSGHHGVYFQVWNDDKQLLYGPSTNDYESPLYTYNPVSRIKAGNLYQWQAEGKTYRGVITQTQIGSFKYTIVTAIDMDAHIQFLKSFHRSLWLIMILAGTVTLLAAWFGVHQGHAPLRGLSATMREIQADRLHVRLKPDDVPRELLGLVTSFNDMIGRLEESFERLSHFSADIAHELRTPLTNIITQTQVILGKSRSMVEYRELHYSNLEELYRLSKMVNDTLWLAKSEHGLLKPVREPLDINQEVCDLFDFFEALAEEKQIQLKLDGQMPLLKVDRVMFQRALSNLLSNALRHSPVGARVIVYLSISNKGEPTISVRNSGPGIPDEHKLRIFDRFYRVDPSRQRQSEGAGLGLAIVKSIVEAHGGRIDVVSSNGETAFTIKFPLTAVTRGDDLNI
ncbi:heavy metal sensor histidine kinase [Kangiella aquimarina]|uniref:heavy metal sensor histidine kinase n=1 Tax=Kangiella aquimarina TaxID=261965 RepID=UPI000362F7D5